MGNTRVDLGSCVYVWDRNEVVGAGGQHDRMRMLKTHLSRGRLAVVLAQVEVESPMVPAPRATERT